MMITIYCLFVSAYTEHRKHSINFITWQNSKTKIMKRGWQVTLYEIMDEQFGLLTMG